MRQLLLAPVIVVAAGVLGPAATLSFGGAPDTLYWEGEHLAAIRSGRTKSERIHTSRLELRRQARIAKRHSPYSVVDASRVPAGGDAHDYVSYGRYWWPDPDADDGLPYIRKDGIVNHDLVDDGDRETLGRFCRDVEVLALTAYLEKDKKAARSAVELLRVWFLDPASKMNPRINYGQLVPGHNTGRSEGILDTRGFLGVIDSISVLEAAGSLDHEQTASLRQWFFEYAEWLATSPLASEARNKRNNHGSWFAAQEAGVALFLGRSEDAREVVQRVCEQRLPDSIKPDGKQPLETQRTRSLSYSMFNLEALVHIARIGDRVGLDVWSHAAPNGASLRGAFEYVAPHLAQQDEWPHKNLKPFVLKEGAETALVLASRRLRSPTLREALEQCRQQAAPGSLASLLFAEGDGR